MLLQVPTVRTSFSVPDFITSLIKTWYGIYNSVPTKAQIGVIYSQWGIETGLGTYTWCFNIGNIKAADIPNQTVKYCALNGVYEIVNGQRVEIPSTSPAAWFRAFDTLDDGVAFYVSFLRNARYKTSWSAIEQGDPILFAHLLKVAGYYTADESIYANGLKYYFNQFMQSTIFDVALKTFLEHQDSITFPPDYTPLQFDLKEDTFERKVFVRASENNKIIKCLNRIKQIILCK